MKQVFTTAIPGAALVVGSVSQAKATAIATISLASLVTAVHALSSSAFPGNRGTSSYGLNSGWGRGWSGHSFASMAINDGAQFRIPDKGGKICLDFVASDVSQSSKFKSGLGTLG
jgi:hypothetical protein